MMDNNEIGNEKSCLNFVSGLVLGLRNSLSKALWSISILTVSIFGLNQSASAQCVAALAGIVGPSYTMMEAVNDVQLKIIAKQVRESTVQLEILDTNGEFMGSCSGTVKGETEILTSAHCFFGEDQQRMFGSVRITFSDDLGRDVNDPNYTEKFQMVSSKIELHSGLLAGFNVKSKEEFFKSVFQKPKNILFKKGIAGLDVAVISLPSSIRGSKSQIINNFNPVKISDGYIPNKQDKVIFAGSGVNNLSKLTSDFKLRFSSLNPGEYNVGDFQKGVLGFTSTKKIATCDGDSGGPVFISNNGQLEVIGINAGSDCELDGKPNNAANYSAVVSIMSLKPELERMSKVFKSEKVASR